MILLLKEKEIKERIEELDKQIKQFEQQANMQLNGLLNRKEELDRILNPEKYEKKEKQGKKLDKTAQEGLKKNDKKE